MAWHNVETIGVDWESDSSDEMEIKQEVLEAETDIEAFMMEFGTDAEYPVDELYRLRPLLNNTDDEEEEHMLTHDIEHETESRGNVSEAGDEHHAQQNQQLIPEGGHQGVRDRVGDRDRDGNREGQEEGTLAAAAGYGGSEEGMQQHVGHDVGHHQLPGIGERALDSQEQEEQGEHGEADECVISEERDMNEAILRSLRDAVKI